MTWLLMVRFSLKKRQEAILPPRGGVHNSQTFEGHEFFYEYNGEANYIVVNRPNANDEQVIAIGRYT